MTDQKLHRQMYLQIMNNLVPRTARQRPPVKNEVSRTPMPLALTERPNRRVLRSEALSEKRSRNRRAVPAPARTSPGLALGGKVEGLEKFQLQLAGLNGPGMASGTVLTEAEQWRGVAKLTEEHMEERRFQSRRAVTVPAGSSGPAGISHPSLVARPTLLEEVAKPKRPGQYDRQELKTEASSKKKRRRARKRRAASSRPGGATESEPVAVRTRSANRQAVTSETSRPADAARIDLELRVTEMKKERSRLDVTAGSGGVESLELEGSSGSVSERISGPGDVIRQNLLKTKQEQSRLDVTARSGGVESLELEGSSGSVSERISGPGSVEGLELSQASSSVAELTGDEHFRLLYPFHEWWWPDPPKGFIDSNTYLFLSRMPLLSPSEAVKTYESSDRDLYSMYRQVLMSCPKLINDRESVHEEEDWSGDLSKALSVSKKPSDPSEDKPGLVKMTTNAGTIPCENFLIANGKNWIAMLKRKAEGKEDSRLAVDGDYEIDGAGEDHGLTCVRQNVSLDFSAYSKRNVVPDTATFEDESVADSQTAIEIETDSPTASQASRVMTDSPTATEPSKSIDMNPKPSDSFFGVFTPSDEWESFGVAMDEENASVSVKVGAVAHIPVHPDPNWYDADYLRTLAKRDSWNHPFTKDVIFGEKGLLSHRINGLVAAYRIAFKVTVSPEAYKKIEPQFNTALGFRIGPFHFGAGITSSKVSLGVDLGPLHFGANIGSNSSSENWRRNANPETATFEGESTADFPTIIGVTVDRILND